MNSLSWLLYWADVLEKVGSTFGAFGLSSILLGTIAMFFVSVARSDAYREEKEQFIVLQKKIVTFVPLFAVPCLLISAFMPSKQTMYLIAGSEIGERAISTPEFNKVRRIVNDFLDEKLNKEDNKEAKKDE